MDHAKANHRHGAQVVLGNGEHEMNLTKDWMVMGWRERILNLITRPFGWDVHVERWHGWTDFKRWDLGVQRDDLETRVFIGPLFIGLDRL